MAFPKMIGPCRPAMKDAELKQAVGKTIKSVEFGEQKTHPKCHQAEMIILHFTDGTSMCVIVGSNVTEIADKRKFKPQEVHTDLMVMWE
ncbi:MAG: hypothetical protein HUU15_05175 [Candidatus Brocadiae bacterium]|nr:hypothetical protein [Candidatus Brocadiia bacterium]